MSLLVGTIHIEGLRLRTILGTEPWERKSRQDIVLHLKMEFDAARASRTDCIGDTINYKPLTKKIISYVESSSHFLIEKLAAEVLKMVAMDDRVQKARIKIEKPQALRYVDSVSFEEEWERSR